MTKGPDEARRITGVVVDCDTVPSRYGGSYGLIHGEDAEYYVWYSGAVYRDGSRVRLGSTVTFEVIRGTRYATNITEAP